MEQNAEKRGRSEGVLNLFMGAFDLFLFLVDPEGVSAVFRVGSGFYRHPAITCHCASFINSAWLSVKIFEG